MRTGEAGSASLELQLSARGIRLTPQRRTLIEAIEAAPGRTPAAVLLRLLEKGNARVDRATVYRTLGLLRRLGLAGRPGCPLRPECRMELICGACGRKECCEIPLVARLRQELVKEKGFAADGLRILAQGRCPGCAGGSTPA